MIAMFDRATYLATLTVYTALAALLLVHFEASILWAMLFLSLLPVVLFWYLEKLHTQYIVWLLLITLSVTTFFEVFAYINNLWSELSPFAVRVFGLFPLEVFLISFIHTLYLIVVYEYFFDDKKSSLQKVLPHTNYLLAGILSLLALAVSYIYLFPGLVFDQPFLALLVLGAFIFTVAIAIFRNTWIQVWRKVLFFSLAIFPTSLIYEYVALNNGFRLFNDSNEFIYQLHFFGQLLPLEELVFIFIVPFWVAMVYELYFDDGK